MRIAADIATYCTGIDPFTGQEVYIAKQSRDRKARRALLQYFKPENNSEAAVATRIPAQRARRERANDSVRGDRVHTVPNEKKQKGYRPGRKSAKRCGGGER